MTASCQHPLLAAGKWYTLSLAEQLGNIGSEVMNNDSKVRLPAGWNSLPSR